MVYCHQYFFDTAIEFTELVVQLPHLLPLLAVFGLVFEKIVLCGLACRLITIFAYVMIMARFLRNFRELYYEQYLDGRVGVTEVS